MSTTTTRPDQRQQSAPPPLQNAVAVIAAPRIPYLPSVKEEFGIGESDWRTLVEATFPQAKTAAAVNMALSYCHRRNLDVFKKPVHIVPIWDNQKRGYIETVWPGISEVRTTAFRTKSYAGMDKPVFGPKLKKLFKGRKKNGDQWESQEAEVEFPEFCEITIWRLVQGQRVQFPGPRVEWMEIYQRAGAFNDVPNDRWKKAPVQMLEKCAEAAALRRAFPEEFGDEWTAEESGAIERHHNAIDITTEAAATTAAPEPKRSDFRDPPPASAPPEGDAPVDKKPGITDAEDLNDKKEEPITFEMFATARAFFDFSDSWLEDPKRTPVEARAWEEFYRTKIKEMAEHKFERIREAIAMTLGLYSAVLAKEAQG